jgi:integrase
LNPHITVHSFRVTAANVARELGVEIVDLQVYLGHKNTQTTLGYLRNLDNKNRSPAYVLKY